MSLTHVQLLSVPVADQDRAKDFYVNTLGFDLVADTPMGPDQRWVQVRPKGSQTSLTLVTWFDTMPPGSLKGLVIETDDRSGAANSTPECRTRPGSGTTCWGARTTTLPIVRLGIVSPRSTRT